LFKKIKLENQKATLFHVVIHAHHNKLHHDTIEEFNVDSKAECGQFNLAQVGKNKKV